MRLLHTRMLMRSYRFLQENPNPTEDEIRTGISGNMSLYRVPEHYKSRAICGDEIAR